MDKRFAKSLIMRCMKGLHLVLTVAVSLAIYFLFYRQTALNSGIEPHVLIPVFGQFVLTLLLERTYESYSVGYHTVSDLTYSQTISAFVFMAIDYVFLCLANWSFCNPLPLLLAFGIQFLINILWSLWANRLYFQLHSLKKTAFLYGNANDYSRLMSLRFSEARFNVVKKVENPQSFEAIQGELKDIECLCVCGVRDDVRNRLEKYCIDCNIPGYFAPVVGDILMRGARNISNFGAPVFCVNKSMAIPEYAIIKRTFDIVCSLIAIVVLSPFMLIPALCIKLYDRGPIFYKQVRLTQNGKQFRIIKFRSMKVDAEKDGVARLASVNDDRITPVGKFIRACRIDELPQLFNILKGDMSIVGPRPERPEIAAQYEKEYPEFNLRLQVKAGLTGYAQVYGKYNSNPYEKLQFDLIYINRMSVRMDLRIMFATVKILFQKESTEGIEAGQTTAMGCDEVKDENLTA